MGYNKTPGLFKKGQFWHIDKRIDGRRLRESTGTGSRAEAERYYAKRLEEIRQATVYGIRPTRTFKEAAIRFLEENQHKRSIRDDALAIKNVSKYIANLPLESVHMGALKPYIEARKREGVKMRTINYGLQVTRRILNLAASEWMDENGLTWLTAAPKIKLLKESDRQKPYPLSWDEQDRLFRELPDHIEKMASFAVNTGCRDQEICKLRWEWEFRVPSAPHLMVFIIPGGWVKNGDDRLVVCNDIAKSVIESVRGNHPEYVFAYRGRCIYAINNNGWQCARNRVGLPHVRVHDLKHTFGRRLRAAGVGLEDRQDLLGHRSGKITTHYSAAEIENLYKAANRVTVRQTSGTLSATGNGLTLEPVSAKCPQRTFGDPGGVIVSH